MAMNHANAQFNTADHVDIGRALRQHRKGVVANANVQSVRQFLSAPLATMTTPQQFNPGHLLPPTDLVGAPHPMPAVARTAVWSKFAANVGSWYAGFTPRAQGPVAAGTAALPGPGTF